MVESLVQIESSECQGGRQFACPTIPLPGMHRVMANRSPITGAPVRSDQPGSQQKDQGRNGRVKRSWS
jgi:hypothetical protein